MSNAFRKELDEAIQTLRAREAIWEEARKKNMVHVVAPQSFINEHFDIMQLGLGGDTAYIHKSLMKQIPPNGYSIEVRDEE